MNILILSEIFTKGGMETHIKSYINNMPHYKFFLATSIVANEVIEENIFKDIYVFPKNRDNAISELSAFIKKNNISLIHAHTAEVFLLCYQLYLASLTPYILTIHGPSSVKLMSKLLNAFKYKIICNSAKKIIVVSNEVESLLKKDNIDSIVINNSIDTNTFKYKRRDLTTKKWALVNRVIDFKANNIKHTMNLLQSFSARQIDFYGNCSNTTSFLSFVKKNKITYKIQFKGFDDNLSESLDTNDYCGVICMGRTLLESLSLGYIVLLLSYDAPKCFVKKKNIKYLSKCNFSGRNILTPDHISLTNEYSKILENESEYMLNTIIDKDYNIQDAVNKYESIIKVSALYNKDI